MSKFSNLLRMIILLKSRGKMKTRELAEELEVDERMIRRYRDDLEKAGVYVVSKSGVNGGYYIEGYDYLLNLSLQPEECSSMNLALEQLKSINFVYNKEFQSLADKINAMILSSNKDINKVEYVVKDSKSLDVVDERKKCLDINAAIISNKKIRLTYFSPNSGESKRVVHPYAIFYYKGAFYMAAFCELRGKVRDFKLSRIKHYEVVDEKYEIRDGFSLKNYMKSSLGIYRDGKLNLKLRIYKPMSYIISEKIWVENQKITWNNDESIIYEAEIEGKTEIISWIMSMGSCVEVIEPQSLKEDIRNELQQMLNNIKEK